jgi:cold shock CspA family protein
MTMTHQAHQKLKGTVKSLKKTEGYGFITHTVTGQDHFFHRSAVERTSPVQFDDLEIDQQVEFTPIEGPKGPRAVEVRPV